MSSAGRKIVLLVEIVSLVVIACAVVAFKNSSSKGPVAKTASKKAVVDQMELFNKDEAFPGYTLIPIEGSEEVRLVTLAGKVVHTWNFDAVRARLLDNGNVLVIHGTKWGLTKDRWRNLRNFVIEYDWDGNEVWRQEMPDVVHHDVQRYPNGNTLILRREMVPPEFKEQIVDAELRKQPIRSDSVHEVTPTGEVVWSWRAHEHLNLNSCGAKPCREYQGNPNALKSMKDWTHMNTISIVPENKWYDEGDTRFKPGNIIVLPRNWWTIFIVSKDTGEIVWEYSGDYRGGISGGHESQMIPKGYPGAGNILVFDNGRKRQEGESIILEVDPTTKEVVWTYENGKAFYSRARGAVQRLPNGNTLISEDYTGRCFEVNQDKKIVWQYKAALETNRCRRYYGAVEKRIETLLAG